jgi:AbrB family looped-hinge helix DNA binding protein
MSQVQATVDSVGRILIPKALRTEFGLVPGSKVDIAAYGRGVQVTPAGREAHLAKEGGRAVIEGEFGLGDSSMFALIDASRR